MYRVDRRKFPPGTACLPNRRGLPSVAVCVRGCVCESLCVCVGVGVCVVCGGGVWGWVWGVGVCVLCCVWWCVCLFSISAPVTVQGTHACARPHSFIPELVALDSFNEYL